MDNLLYFLISIATSIIGSISGIGGGVILKPVMDSFKLMDIAAISFLSGCTVLCMSGVSLLRSSRDAAVRKGISIFLAIGASAGGIIGKSLFLLLCSLSENIKIIGMTQTVILLLINIGVIIYMKFKNKVRTHDLNNRIVCVAAGVSLGVISSFLGIGGGPLNVIILYFLFSMEPKEAVLNSLFIIFCSQITSLVNSAVTGTIPDFEWQILVIMCIGGAAGAAIGRSFAKKMSTGAVEKLFICVLALLIGLNIFNMSQLILY